MTPSLRVCAVTRKPQSASFEQRVLRHVEPLRDRGIEVTCRTFPSKRAGKAAVLAELPEYDAVWWHRHLVHPLWLRRWRASTPIMVFDFDDPVCFTAAGGGRRHFARSLKFAMVLRRCDAVMAGSNWLQDLATKYCPNVHLVPMAVDLPPSEPRDVRGDVELLWVGSPATQPYLEEIRAPLERLGDSHPDVTLRLVAHEPMRFGALRVDYRPWSKSEQDAALRECAIGLCPMPDSPWTSGKCPYKVLQYQGSNMPWIGSAVGENLIVAGPPDDERGLCVTGDEPWYAAMLTLIEDAPRRTLLGERGRRYVQSHHARDAVADRLAAVWKGIVQ